MKNESNKIINASINISYVLKKEIFRKTIHMMAAFLPFFYYLFETHVLVFLLVVTLIYFISEILRTNKKNLFIISRITEIASRDRDEEKIILGPITLTMGVFLAFTLFDYRSAVIAIFALAFGDGVASLFGKVIGGYKIPFTFGKTFSGTLGCFFTLCIVYVACSLNFYQAIILAFVAAVIEAFPTGDYDNILISVGTGLVAQNWIL